MGTMYWLRVVGMVAVLTAVLWSMHNLNKGHTGIPLVAPKGASPVLELCPTRITWLDVAATGEHLEEHNTHWMKSVANGPMEELDAVSTEKWFSRFCQGKLTATDHKSTDWKNVMKIGYVEGQERVLKVDGEHDFQIDGLSFKSDDLEAALSTLASIPKLKKPGE